MWLVDTALDSAGSRRELLIKITKKSIENYSCNKYWHVGVHSCIKA